MHLDRVIAGKVLTTLVCLLFVRSAAAEIIHVDTRATGANNGTSWVDAYKYLQDALTDANSSPKPIEIYVAQGIYRPDCSSANPDGTRNRTATFQLIDSVAIYGGFPSGGGCWNDRDPNQYETILSGDLDGNDIWNLDTYTNYGPDYRSYAENAHHVITAIGTDERAVVDGLTVTAGCTDYWDVEDQGGGMYVYAGSPTIRDCTFKMNYSLAGGGMYNYLANPTLTNCTFSHNYAGSLGGSGVCNRTSNPTFVNCSFVSNIAYHGASGGGIRNDWSSSPTLINCIFDGNRFQEGGGMYTSSGEPILLNCIFSRNVAGRGGGIYGNATAVNCVFIANSAHGDGGGVYGSGVLTNCTVYGNSAGNAVGGIRGGVLTNCILWGNRDDGGMDRSAQVSGSCSYSCIQGWTGGGVSNIADNPLFVDPDGADEILGTQDDNLRLLPHSPCVDAADNDALPADVWDLDGDGDLTEPVPFDLDSDSRFADSPDIPDAGNGAPPICDMGAYENPKMDFLLSTRLLIVPEGGITTFTVALTLDPKETVCVMVTRQSGDSDVTVQSGSSLTFNSSNYSAPQTVTLAAMEDEDKFNGIALIWVSAPGLITGGITAIEADNEPDPNILFVDDTASGNNNGMNWKDALTDLQEALTIARAFPQFKEIRVAQGVYRPAGPGGDREATFQLLAGVHIIGAYAGFGEPNPDVRDVGAYETILSGDVNGDDAPVLDPSDLLDDPTRAENSYRVVSGYMSDATAVIDGFTITGGNANGQDPRFPNYDGGGMYTASQTDSGPTVINCVFRENAKHGMLNEGGPPYGGRYCNPTVIDCSFSRNYGVGMCNSYKSSPTVIHCTFSENGDDGLLNSEGDAVITDCTFVGNTGAGMYNGGNPEIIRCTFSENSFGGLYNTGNPLLIDCTFKRNAVTWAWGGQGGGMSNRCNPALLSGNPVLLNCTFIENSTKSDGGGMYNERGSPVLVNCNFRGNSAWHGGAMYNTGGMYSTDCNAVLISCSFRGNMADADGSAIFCEDGNAELANCTFVGNSAPQGDVIYGADACLGTLRNCILYNNGGSAFGGWTQGNLTVTSSIIKDSFNGRYTATTDPLLTPDGHIRGGSPCIDAGDSNAVSSVLGGVEINSAVLDAAQYDIDGDSRFADDPDVDDTGSGTFPIVDIGTDEWLDTDRDCLPDWWEEKYFGDPNIADPNADPDGDDLTNLEEYELYSSDPDAGAYYVDVNNIDDPDADGTAAHPFRTIREAMNVAGDGDTILVAPGTYMGPDNIDLDFAGRSIVLCSMYPDDRSLTIIDCNLRGRAFDFHSGESAGAAVVGFTITNGQAEYGGAIRCEQASPQFRNCIFMGNTSRAQIHSLTFPWPGEESPYDFSKQAESWGAADLYYLGVYNVFLADWMGQRGLVDLGPVALKDIKSLPESGYCRSGVEAVVGHSYVALAHETEEGYYILFTVTDLHDYSVTIEWVYIDGRGWPEYGLPSGAIYCYRGFPTLDNCLFADNDLSAVWVESGGIQIIGTVSLISNDWVGDESILAGPGTLRLDASSILDLSNSSISCNISGPGTIQVDLDSELIIESDAVIDLGHDTDPNLDGRIMCDGLLHLRGNSTLMNAEVHVSRASVEDNAIIANCVVTAEAGAPYGQFFIEDNVGIYLDRIEADGDRYLDLDPADCNLYNISVDMIDVNVSEGVGGTHGGLFELRGEPNLVDVIACDPNNPFFCQVQTIPPFDTDNWTISRLELVEGAKLNLTNRFDFQYPYDFGGDNEVLYVKELLLGPNSVLNTAYNHIYYETVEAHPTAQVICVPLLGFSLNNISFDDENDYVTRVKTNNFIHPFTGQTQSLVGRVFEQPDPNGMMKMANWLDKFEESATFGQVFKARAKGLFAKSSEDKILIQFEYLFCDPNGSGELVIYLSDVPELLSPGDPGWADHYIQVATLRHPPSGRPGSAGSGRFATFYKDVSKGHLDFIRGTRVELELLGPDGTCILINNWDPAIRCNLEYCGDIAGEFDVVNAIDFLAAVSECGRRIGEVRTLSGATISGCLDGFFCRDGVVTTHDALAIDWHHRGHLCPAEDILGLLGGSAAGIPGGEATEFGTRQSLSHLATHQSGLDFSLLVLGKRHNSLEEDFLSDRLYGLDEQGNLLGGPFDAPNNRLNGKLVSDHSGNLYSLNLEDGVVRLSDLVAVLPPSSCLYAAEPRHGGAATVYIGIQDQAGTYKGYPIMDAAFDEQGYVYVVPVVVSAEPGRPYMAAARLRLDPEKQPTPYEVIQIYDNPIDPADNLDPNNLREIEIDNEGNVYVLNVHGRNESDTLWIYDASTGTPKNRLTLNNPTAKDGLYIPAPVGMHVSNTAGRLYLGSSLNEPDASSTVIFGIPVEQLIASDDPRSVVTVNIEVDGMGHVTDIAEDPSTGTLWVVGFTMSNIPSEDQIQNASILNEEPFYRPSLSRIPCCNGGAQLVQLPEHSDAGFDLALPLSIAWIGPSNCSVVDFDSNREVTFADFAVLSEHWLERNCDWPEWCGGADLNKTTEVDMADLVIFSWHWLGTGCTTE